MITFKQWLLEAYHSSWAHVDIYKNPNQKELGQLKNNKHKEVKALLHGDDVYAWHPEHGYHDQIRAHLGHKVRSHEDSIGIYLGHEKANGTPHKFFALDGAAGSGDYDDTLKKVANHPFIKKHGYKTLHD